MRISDWSSDVCSSDVGYGIQTWNRWNAGPCAHRQNDLADFYRHIVNDQSTVGNACLALDIAYTLIDGQQIDIFFLRSEDRRVGKERVSTCRYRWPLLH